MAKQKLEAKLNEIDKGGESKMTREEMEDFLNELTIRGIVLLVMNSTIREQMPRKLRFYEINDDNLQRILNDCDGNLLKFSNMFVNSTLDKSLYYFDSNYRIVSIIPIQALELINENLNEVIDVLLKNEDQLKNEDELLYYLSL